MLDKKGLSSSEASRVTIFLKETVKGMDVNIDNFQVISSTTKRDGEELKLDTAVKIDNWKDKIIQKANYFALSAWLMEAVKYKDSLISEKRDEPFTGEVEGLLPYPTAPVQGKSDIGTFLRTLTIKQQAEYYTQQTMSAHIGKFIHNFDKLRTVIEQFEPTTFKKINDKETLTVKNELLYEKSELLEDVESLTGNHRESEKLKNYYEKKHKDFQAEVKRQYLVEFSKYNIEHNSVVQHNNSLRQVAINEFESKKTKELEELYSLNIVIPKELQPTLDEVLEKLNKNKK